jgi:methionine-rich copper-binding protein CopC
MRSLLPLMALALAAASPALAQDPHAGHGAHAGHAPQAGAAEHAAHGVVTSPADGAMTDGSPEWFTATFPHAMTLKSVTVNAAGQAAVTVPVAAAAATTRVSAALPTLAPGNYVLNWTAEGEDGHQMTGAVRFMVH